jgi:membrane protease subunit HflK
LARGSREGLGTEQRVRRGVLRTLTHSIVLLTSLAVIGGWFSTGFYKLELGEAAVILRWGRMNRIETREGLNWHWPEPLEYETAVNVSGLRSEEFGMARKGGSPDGDATTDVDGFLNFIQTADSNIVNASFELQYTVDDPYAFVFGMAEPRLILHDATQAAVREVIGRKSVDEVLFRNRREIESEARKILERTLAEYFRQQGQNSAFSIDRLNLQTVHPPEQVRAAFEDVVSAQQDEERSISRARGDARVILEQAQAQATELIQSSEAYREVKVLESKGEATRFDALLAEYRRAPEVTRERLYLETMEQIMPGVEKLIVQPETVSVLPWLPGRAPAAQPAAPEAGR